MILICDPTQIKGVKSVNLAVIKLSLSVGDINLIYSQVKCDIAFTCYKLHTDARVKYNII